MSTLCINVLICSDELVFVTSADNSQLTTWSVRCRQVCFRRTLMHPDRRCRPCLATSPPRPDRFCFSPRLRSVVFWTRRRTRRWVRTENSNVSCVAFQTVQASSDVKTQEAAEVRGQPGLNRKRKKMQLTNQSEAERRLESRSVPLYVNHQVTVNQLRDVTKYWYSSTILVFRIFLYFKLPHLIT